MRVLALDCSLSAAAAAVWDDGRTLAVRAAEPPRGIAEALMPLAVAALADAGIGFDALDAVAVTVGPGSFTGIRAGLAAARGIALARALPVVGVTTLEALAAAALARLPGATALAVVDSRRGDVFVQPFGPGPAPLAEPAAIEPAAILDHLPAGPVAIAGDGAARIGAVLAAACRDAHYPDGCRLPDPSLVAALGAARLAACVRAGTVPPPPLPLYLAPPRASLPAAEGRLRP